MSNQRMSPTGDSYSFTWPNSRQLKVRFAPTKNTDTLKVLSVLPDAPGGLCDISGWVLHAVDGTAVGQQAKQRVQERLKQAGSPITLEFRRSGTETRADELVSTRGGVWRCIRPDRVKLCAFFLHLSGPHLTLLPVMHCSPHSGRFESIFDHKQELNTTASPATSSDTRGRSRPDAPTEPDDC